MRWLSSPSATSTRPSGRNATSCGRPKWVSSLPPTFFSPSVSSSSRPSLEKTKIWWRVSLITHTRRSGS